MKVLLIRPGEAPEIGELNGYKEMSDFVGGWFETVDAFGYKIVCNDSFLLNDTPYNVTIDGVQFFGNIFVCKEGILAGEPVLVGLDDSDFHSFSFFNYFVMCKCKVKGAPF